MIEYRLPPGSISHNGHPESLIYEHGQIYVLKEPCRFEVQNGHLCNLDVMIFSFSTSTSSLER